MSSITKVYILLLSSFLYHAISCSDMDRSGHGKRVRACVFQPPLPASTWPTCLTYRSHVIATKTRVPRDAFNAVLRLRNVLVLRSGWAPTPLELAVHVPAPTNE